MGSSVPKESLSNFEWEIMKQIWQLGSASAREVLDILPREHRRAYTTIQTYLERLVEKGFLSKEKLGLVNFYRPLVQQELAVSRATDRFVAQVFAGSRTRLAAFLFGKDEITHEELEKIRTLLEDDHE